MAEPEDDIAGLRRVSRAELEADLDYALRHKVRLPMVGSRKVRWSGLESRIAAASIAAYLWLCGLRPMRKPPLQGHGGSFGGSKDE